MNYRSTESYQFSTGKDKMEERRSVHPQNYHIHFTDPVYDSWGLNFNCSQNPLGDKDIRLSIILSDLLYHLF